MAEDPSSRPHRPMDIEDSMRDGENEYDHALDTTVRIIFLFLYRTFSTIIIMYIIQFFFLNRFDIVGRSYELGF